MIFTLVLSGFFGIGIASYKIKTMTKKVGRKRMKKEYFWSKKPRVIGELPKGNGEILPQCLRCTHKARIKWSDKYSTFYLCVTHSQDLSEAGGLAGIHISRLDKIIKKIESEKRWAA
jgi:hypothetical protein